MKKIIASLFMLLVFTGTAAANKDYPLTLTVQTEVNHASGDTSHWIRFGVEHHSRDVVKYIDAIGSDGNEYQFVPKDKKLLVIPGAYSARLEKDDVIILIGGHEEKLIVVAVRKMQ